MRYFNSLSKTEQKHGAEILTFMFESTDTEFQAYLGKIPMTPELYTRITQLLEQNNCRQLLKEFTAAHPRCNNL